MLGRGRTNPIFLGKIRDFAFIKGGFAAVAIERNRATIGARQQPVIVQLT